jgi:hypothetical protein
MTAPVADFDAFASRVDHFPAGPHAAEAGHTPFGAVENYAHVHAADPADTAGATGAEPVPAPGLPADVTASLQLPEHARPAADPQAADERPDDDELDGYRLPLRRGHWIQVASLDVISNKERNALQRTLTVAKAGDDEQQHIALDRAFTATKAMQADLLAKLIEGWSFPIALPATPAATDELPGWAGRYLDEIFNKALIGLFPEFNPSLNASSPTPPSAA